MEAASVPRGDADDPSGRVVDDRCVHGGLLVQLRSGRDRVVGEQLVELRPRPDQPVRRELGQLRPGQLERLGASAVDPQALVAHPAGLGADVDAQLDQLLDRAWGEPVPAHLLSGEARLLEQDDVESASGEIGGGRRSPGARPDHDNVGVGSECWHSAKSRQLACRGPFGNAGHGDAGACRPCG